MIQHYVLTLIGDDRPGLIDELADLVKVNSGNWEESRLANLAGKFSGIVLVSVPESAAEDFEKAILGMKNSDLSVRATSAFKRELPDLRSQTLNVMANDRPGILSEVSMVLAQLGINIEELTTDCKPAPMSSETLFTAKARISIPDGVSEERLSEALEQLADDLVVEFGAT